jgi:hypothetical protein
MATGKFKTRNSRSSVGGLSVSNGGPLNDYFRNGGDITEYRENGCDCITAMRLAQQRPDILAYDLRAMGVMENGDDPPDDLRFFP